MVTKKPTSKDVGNSKPYKGAFELSNFTEVISSYNF